MNTTVWQTLIIMLVAMVFLAVFNSSSLQTWSFDLQPSPVNDVISLNAERWHILMEEVGAAGITEAIRETFSEMTGAF
ncbi:MAG: hypothetical protein ABJK39_02735 [Hyphomicrobiales bacterium]